MEVRRGIRQSPPSTNLGYCRLMLLWVIFVGQVRLGRTQQQRGDGTIQQAPDRHTSIRTRNGGGVGGGGKRRHCSTKRYTVRHCKAQHNITEVVNATTRNTTQYDTAKHSTPAQPNPTQTSYSTAVVQHNRSNNAATCHKVGKTNDNKKKHPTLPPMENERRGRSDVHGIRYSPFMNLSAPCSNTKRAVS